MVQKLLSQEFREGDLQELIQGRAILVDLCPQHRTLPGMDDELRQRFGGEVPGDRAGLLRLADHAGNLIAPGSKRLVHTLADERALIGKLGREIPQQASGRELGPDRGLIEALEIFSQPPQRGQPRVPQDAQTRLDLPLIPSHDLCGERLLAFEVVVEGPFGSARCIGDVLDAGGIEPPLVQGFEAGGEDLLAKVGPWHMHYMTGRLGIVKATGSGLFGITTVSRADQGSSWPADSKAGRSKSFEAPRRSLLSTLFGPRVLPASI